MRKTSELHADVANHSNAKCKAASAKLHAEQVDKLKERQIKH